MARPIRWLHLSDLHYGCPGKELWEQVEEKFFADVESQLRRLGPPDLLIFTGDLAYSGKAEEYAQVDAFLEELLGRIAGAGSPEPVLVAVPGNHDVARPEGRALREYHVLRSFDGTTDDSVVAGLYDELWKRRDASFIDGLFPGYRAWFERRARPQLEKRTKTFYCSHFPCDFTAVVEPEGAFPLVLVGLNSTWMQYSGDDFDGKLLIPFEQFRAALAPLEERKAYSGFDGARSLLLMHQPPDWLSLKGRDLFYESIYQPSRFTACLFGHMHKANSTLFQSGGGLPRVFLQSPSLFGLEHWGKKEEDRALGYSWGQLEDDGELRLWPRKLDRRHDKVWSFGHDPGFHEDLEGVLLRPGERSRSKVAVEQRGVDLRPYLARLIERTETLEIRGIAGDRNQAAISPPIENLYTPLRMRGGGGWQSAVGGEALQAVLGRSRRVLIEGDPGAGKTTFLRFAACMLARDADGRPCPGQRSWSEQHLGLKLEKPPVPIFLRLAGLVPLLSTDSRSDDRLRLLELLATEWQSALLDREYWQRLLEEGGAWLLLDGLDEVADLQLRSRLFEIVKDATVKWQAPLVVASRPFQTEKLVEMGFLVATVEPFGKEEIEAFLAFWTAAVHRQDPRRAREGQSGRYLERLQEAILTRPQVRALARNPVMLTCLCVVHWNRGDLPDVRSRVYEAVIYWLLNARAELRRERTGVEPDLAQRALSRLGLGAMSSPGGKQSILEMGSAVAAVRPVFERFFQGDEASALERRIERWLLFECESSGVVEELAGGRLRFWHLTFQEFLAALELARGEMAHWWPVLAERFDQAQWWETTELFVTCLYDLGRPESVDQLFERLLTAGGEKRDLRTDARMVGVVGRLLQPLQVCGYRPAPELQAAYDTARHRTMAIFEPEGAVQVPIGERIAAAEALGRCGDPRLRPEVGNFRAVPDTAVLLGKYPVTVEEYQRFVDARGYEDERWWEDGWAVKEKEGWENPGSWEGQLATPNRPVVEVSWWEAMAYCRWLSDQRGVAIRLPTEGEWQAAATHPKGEYPWGKAEPDEELANFKHNVGRPTPVGVYPQGAGIHGHFDLAGNIWEWCIDAVGEGSCHLQGGAWYESGSNLRSLFYRRVRPEHRVDYVGFRVSCPAEMRAS